MLLREFEEGEEVTITAVVAGKNDKGQVFLWLPGVGGSGRWTVPGGVLASAGGDEKSRDLLRQAVRERWEVG